VAEFCTTGCFIDSGLDHGIFWTLDISQGSVVTQLRCGEIVSHGFVANLILNLPVKEVWKSVNIWRSYGQYCSALFFWLTVYILVICVTTSLCCTVSYIITTFTVYADHCDLRKYFISIQHILQAKHFRFVCKHTVVNMCYISFPDEWRVERF